MTKPASQLSESKQSIQWAATPFDKPKAESVILRSTDNIYFNVRRGILAEVSPIFEDMFAQSSPAQDAALSLRYEDETIDGVSVILMHETSFVIDFFLRLYYPPFEVRSPQAIDDAFGILSTARKFLMPQYAQKIAEQKFVAFAAQDPIRVYAVARRSRLIEESRLAARASLDQPLAHERLAELRDISGADYCNLLRYRTACVTATTEVVLTNNDNIPPCPWLTMKSFFWSTDDYRGRGKYSPSLLAMQCASGSRLYAPYEFRTYLKAVSEALSECPSSKVLSNLPLSKMMWAVTVARSGTAPCSSELVNEVLSLEKELAHALDDAVSKVILDVD